MNSPYADALELAQYWIAWAVLVPTWLMAIYVVAMLAGSAVTHCLIPHRRLRSRWEWQCPSRRSRSWTRS